MDKIGQKQDKNHNYTIKPSDELGSEGVKLHVSEKLKNTYAIIDKTPKGITVDKAKKIMNAFMVQNKYDIPVNIIIKKSQSETYGKSSWETHGRIQGSTVLYRDEKGNIQGDISLITGNFTADPKELLNTLRHELLSYVGINLLPRLNRQKVLSRIYNSRFGPLRAIYQDVKSRYPDLSRNIVAEEMLSMLAETYKQTPVLTKLWRITIDLIVKILRHIGLFKKTYTHAELEQVISHLEKGIINANKLRYIPKGYKNHKKSFMISEKFKNNRIIQSLEGKFESDMLDKTVSGIKRQEPLWILPVVRN